MPDYDFHQLSPNDFEVLSRDLLQADWGVKLENFKSGKDRGIDLRYSTADGSTIVQCKHYVRTGIAGLLRDIAKEAVKVRALNPKRYVLVTSVPLSPDNKDAIIALLGADILTSADVKGREELNNLLTLHPKIEQTHFKLWLASRTVLDRVLHNAEITQSEFKARQVYQEAKRYVQSSAYPKAVDMLGQQGIAIIAGPPGVGKTTLANLLLYTHLEKDYQVVLIQRDIMEAQKLFHPDKKQIFYFDDFMGTTFLGDGSLYISGNNDRALVDFISMVRSSANSRFVLTTREQIFSQAMAKSERLRQFGLDDFRVYLSMPSYSLVQRANILYNHLYFSDLPFEYQDELLKGDWYLTIVKHEKFNPRLIEWLSSFRRVRDVPVDRYRPFISNLLKNPAEIWRHAYEQQTSDAGRSLLLTLFSLEGKAGDAILKSCFSKLHQLRASNYGFMTRPEDFKVSLRECAGTFVKPWGTGGIEFIDPSVLDLLNTVLLEVPENAVDILEGANLFQQFERVWSFASANSNATVLHHLRKNVARWAPSLRQRMLLARRVDRGGGSVVWFGPSFERRLAVVVNMARRINNPTLDGLISDIFERLIEEWRTERPQISDAVEALNELESLEGPQASARIPEITAIRTELLADVDNGWRAEELREVLRIVETRDSAIPEEIDALKGAFEQFKQSHFYDDLHDCRSIEQFDGLIEDLEFFQSELGVDVEALIERVEEAKGEFDDHQSAYEDHMADEWKERGRFERSFEQGVSDMFGSLKYDR